ncbi:MAG: hypothetical protein QM621_14870 [Aeromicrobium sp.]|uniref:hypothetical protein n=1 Tax=Aeromicrobium sp. TaxID=1871063 RepID=UPI0039E26F6A
MAALGTRTLTLELDGEEVDNQISTGKITTGEADSDFVTFADARAGGKREYKLVFTGVQDAAEGSLWDLVWSHSGEDVPFLLRPYGNEVPTPAQPHFAGVVTVSEPDGDLLGGDADASPTARFTFECEWVCQAKPVKITA